MTNAYSQMPRAELIARLESLESGQDTAALRDAEERMRAILETAVEGIITIDERGNMELVNPAAEKIFGYSAAEMVGRNVNMLMPAPHREAHDGYIANYLHTGEAKVIGIGREVAGRRKDGSTFPMELSVSEVRLAHRRLFTGFVRDITERKRTELRQQVQYATAGALSESNALSEGAPKVMRAICEIMGWSFGEFWAVDREAKVIHHVQSWYSEGADFSEFERQASRMFCGPGE